ncbi:multidrug effflux MFS transporter [Aestuariivirga sp.]|uniref:multidrug effflux MFS transporter n=1 Tax=Aestuariivirga sp. TaxID=2650926 RepID=UPI0039E590A5
MRNTMLSLAEFIPLMGLMTALDALSIDSLLPAFPAISRDLSVASGNSIQLLVSAMFFGMAFGQIIGGPASDAYGRRPAIIGGLIVYALGSALGYMAQSFEVLLIARVMQGFGASIPVVVMTALVRDLYEGAPMARIMSFIGTVFIIVPILAPLAGQGILLVSTWRTTFLLYLVLAAMSALWFTLRQPETLPKDRRMVLSLSSLFGAAMTVLKNRVAIGYIVAGGLLFGAFLGYLNSAQQIFQQTYDMGIYFVLLFSTLALAIGAALLTNGWLVERFGMQKMTLAGFAGVAGASIIFLPVAFAFNGVPPLWLTMLYLAVSFFSVGILFGNLQALAMEPLGEVAGVGAAIVSFAQTIFGLPLGTYIGQSYDGTVIPLVSGFALLCSLGLAAMWLAERGRGFNVQRES